VLTTLNRQLRVFAGAGALAWLFMVATGQFMALAEGLIGLAMVCVIPLGAALAADADASGRARRSARIAAFGVPLGASLGLVGFALPPGATAAALASAWLAGTLTLFAAGAARLLRRGAPPIEELAIDVGHLYLPVGAVWLVASRAGVPLLGFHEPVVLFTAAHFHFAGFAAPVVAGLLGRELGLRRAPSEGDAPLEAPRVARLYAVTTIVVLLGIPLVAAGITLAHVVELPAAILLSMGMLGTMGFLVRAGLRRLSRGDGSGGLLGVAGTALVLSMALVVLFASTGSATRGAGISLVPYDTMATIHGTANALGFATCALLAFTWRPPRRRHDALGGSWPRLFGRGFIGPRFFDRAGAVDEAREVSGQVGSLDDFAHDGFAPGHVHAAVRDFYEHTARYELSASPDWHPPFRTFGRVFVWLARHLVGQLVLPTRPDGDDRVSTRLFAVRDASDGRTDVRGYVRAHGEGEGARANFVAAYSTHLAPRARLLSASCPLPFCALVGVLRFEDGERPGSLFLTSRPRAGEGPGDEGLFLATPFGAVRLPMNERIDVWVADDGALCARHATHVLGLRCFTLAYALRVVT
jgi:YndJ-like protein